MPQRLKDTKENAQHFLLRAFGSLRLTKFSAAKLLKTYF